jgi:hypothetical protein
MTSPRNAPNPQAAPESPRRSGPPTEWWNLERRHTSWLTIGALGCAAVATLLAVRGLRPSDTPQAIERRWRELQADVTAAIDAGRPADAVSAAQSALSLAVAKFKEPNPAIAESCRRLAAASLAAGDYSAAGVAAERAAGNYEALLGQGNLETAAVVGEYGMILGRLGRFAEARPLLEGVLKACEKLAGPDAAATAAAIQNLADFNLLEAGYDAAAPLYERAVEITTKTAGPAGLPTAAAMAGLGACLARGTDTAPKAEELLERSRLIQQRAAGPADTRLVPTLLHLAALRQAQKQPEQAETTALEALAISEARFGPRHPETAAALVAYAGCAQTRDDLPLAQQCLDRAAVIRNNTLGLGHPDTIATLDQLIDVLVARGDYTKAEKPCRALLQGLADQRPEDAAATRRAAERLAVVLDNTARAEEAKTLRQRFAPPAEAPAAAVDKAAPAPAKAAR